MLYSRPPLRSPALHHESKLAFKHTSKLSRKLESNQSSILSIKLTNKLASKLSSTWDVTMILALANSKGGVGKSTIAVHLATWLHEKGKNLVFVDADVQGSSSGWLAEAAPKMKAVRLLTRKDILDQLPNLAVEFDYVVADGPAGLSEVTRSILCYADVAIFPCGPSILDLKAVIAALDVNKQIQAFRKGLPREVVVPNKLQMQYKLSKELLETVKAIGTPVGEGLRLRQAYADAAGQGTVVWRMNTESARGAANELEFLFQQLLSYEATPSKSVGGVEAGGIAT
jgi:chromosome partitioning protein